MMDRPSQMHKPQLKASWLTMHLFGWRSIPQIQAAERDERDVKRVCIRSISGTQKEWGTREAFPTRLGPFSMTGMVQSLVIPERA